MGNFFNQHADGILIRLDTTPALENILKETSEGFSWIGVGGCTICAVACFYAALAVMNRIFPNKPEQTGSETTAETTSSESPYDNK
jgi:hypothetical protein